MTKITNITRGNVKKVLDDIDEAVKAVGEKWGLSIKLTSTSFNDAGFRTKIDAGIVGEGGVNKADEKLWRDFATLNGLDPDAFGKTFTYGGKTFTIVGVKTKSSKYPIIGLNGDGKRYKFPISVLDTASKKSEAEPTNIGGLKDHEFSFSYADGRAFYRIKKVRAGKNPIVELEKISPHRYNPDDYGPAEKLERLSTLTALYEFDTQPPFGHQKPKQEKVTSLNRITLKTLLGLIKGVGLDVSPAIAYGGIERVAEEKYWDDLWGFCLWLYERKAFKRGETCTEEQVKKAFADYARSR